MQFFVWPDVMEATFGTKAGIRANKSYLSTCVSQTKLGTSSSFIPLQNISYLLKVLQVDISLPVSHRLQMIFLAHVSVTAIL